MAALSLFLSAWIVGGAANGVAQAPIATQPARAAVSDNGVLLKRQCKRIVPVGSIMPKRICLSNGDWQRFNDLNEEASGRVLERRGGGMCTTPPDCRPAT